MKCLTKTYDVVKRMATISFFTFCFLNITKAQSPISSLYQNLIAERSSGIKKLYEIIDAYSKRNINEKTYIKSLLQLPQIEDDRYKALYNMALSYSKTEDEDFGFYNLRLAVNYADKLNQKDRIKGVVFAEFANYLEKRETHDLAIEYFRQAVQILRNNQPKGVEGTIFSIENKILKGFTQLGEEDSVTFYLGKVIETAREESNTLWLASGYNNKGYNFYQNKAYDSALFYFNLSKSVLNPNDTVHIVFIENVNENISHILADKGNLKQAIDLITNVFDVRLQYDKTAVGLMQAFKYLLDYCQKTGQINIAQEKFETLQKKLNQENKDFEKNKKYLEIRLLLAQMTGDQVAYHKYFEKLLERQKVELENEKQLLVNRRGINKFVKSRNELFEKQVEIERLQKEQIGHSLTITKILIICLLLFGAGLLYFLNHFNKAKKKMLQIENEKLLKDKKIAELENLNLKVDLDNSEKDISRVVADNKLRTEIKKDFVHKLNKLSTFEDSKIKIELKKLLAQLEQTIEQHTKLDLLQENINSINAEFEHKLRERIKGISPSEIEICGLIRLGYNNSEISKIVNKTIENVRVNKFRIKQKAGMNDMKEFEVMLISL